MVVGERCEKDDRDVVGRRVVLQLAANLEAIHARHLNIEQNQIGAAPASPDQNDRALVARGGLHPVTAFESAGHDSDILGNIIDYQYRFLSGVRIHVQYPSKDAAHRHLCAGNREPRQMRLAWLLGNL